MDPVQKQILDELREIKKAQVQNSIRTQRIERVLIGDPDYKQEGLVDTVKAHQEYISNDKLRNAKQAGVMAVITIAFSGMIEAIKAIFKA